MVRLVTGGCSFTQYFWNTWADYLGMHYDEFEQTGHWAIDNATVARRVMDTVKSGDDVVISWTGMDRWAPYKNGKWQYYGCIASNKDYFVNHYHPIERFTTTMDYIKMVELDSKVKGYNVWHFTSYPFFQGEVEKEIDPQLVDICKSYNIKNLYIDKDLDTFKTNLNDTTTSHKYNSTDIHPTPNTHWQWLEQVIAPILNINLDSKVKDRVKYDQERVLNGDVD